MMFPAWCTSTSTGCNPGAKLFAEPVADIVKLVDFMDVSVTASHARGHELISECWTTYRPIAVEQGNPLYLAVSDAKPSGELLDFVPANAIAFDMTQNIELRPLYHWVLDRVEYYEPKAAKALVFLNAAQAAVDYSIEDDLLSWLGSESIVITLPSQRPGSPTDTIIISRLRDREGARKTLRRFEAVFQELVPPLLEQWEEDMARDGSSSWIRKFEMTDAGGSFPFMKRLDIAISIPGSPIPIPSIPAVNFGVIGNFLMITTSEEALETVMAVAAGEEDGIWEHPAMLPEGRLAGPQAWSASLQPVGQQIQEAAGVCNTVAGIAGMMAMSIPSDGSTGYAQGQQMIALMTDGLRKVASIMQAMDFLDDSVTYTEMRDDGMTHYSRTSVRYLVDEGP